MKPMLLSVIVPTYNRASYLSEAIDSLAAQEIAADEMEVLVIDDGSTDNTEETMHQITLRYPAMKLRYIRQEHRGISFSRNNGVLSAKGEWIGFLDSDDRWHPEKLKKQFMYLAEHPDCRILFTRYRNFLDTPAEAASGNQQILLRERESHYLASALVHRSLFETSGLFCETIPVGEDTEWVLRNRLLSVDIDQLVDEPLYYRRIHDSNISLSYRDNEENRHKIIVIMALRMAASARKRARSSKPE